MHRHAQASTLELALSRDVNAEASPVGRLCCYDDGIGFDPKVTTGRGIEGIRERARTLQATLTINSSTETGGTTLTLIFPLS